MTQTALPSRLSEFVFSKITLETKLILMLTCAYWIVSYGIRYFTIENWMQEGIYIMPIGIPVLALLWWICHTLKHLPLLLVIALGIPVSVGMEILHGEVWMQLQYGHFSWQADWFTLSSYVYQVYLWSLFYFTWYFGYFAIMNYCKFTREVLVAAQARADMHNMQLQSLRYQINPHFLFNTLNSISTLILDKQNAQAENAIESLSRFLRFSLDNTKDSEVAWAEEVSVAKDYLNIEAIRFPDRLKVEFHIDPQTLKYMVPSLILHPILENAIKHAITPFKTPGTISIMSTLTANSMKITITNDGPALDEAPHRGAKNLSNIRTRIQSMYGDQAHLEMYNNPKKGVSTCLHIPLTKAPLQNAADKVRKGNAHD